MRLNFWLVSFGFWLFTVFVCCFDTAFYAQEIKVGHRVPDVVLKSSGGNLPASFTLSSLKKDLILLDFWSFTCKSCIQSFSKMEELQNKFHDRIQILLINDNSPDATEKFFKKRNKLRKPNLPFISGGILSEFFPQNFNPWHVWIDRDLRVKYITSGESATTENITMFLNGQPLNVTQLTYIPTDETLINKAHYEEFASSAEYYSCLTRYIPNGMHLENYSGKKFNGKVRFSRSPATAISLFKDAFIPKDEVKQFQAANTVILDIDNTEKYVMPDNPNRRDKWKAINLFNYDLIIPEEKENLLYQFVREDLQRYFNLRARIETRKIECLVLMTIPGSARPQTKGGITFDSLYIFEPQNARPYSAIRRAQNIPYWRFVDKLSAWTNYFLKVTLIDSTDYHGNIDIQMNGRSIDQFDLGSINSDLKPNGLHLVKKYCERPVLVISDKANRR